MLYEFYGEECPHCKKMRKLTDKLMQEYPAIKIERKEVWHNKKNMELIKQYDEGDKCGGVPFFYNDETKAWLCGEVKYSEMKEWAGVE
jgi:thiol-disulfide isomerase/thioredoxin